MLALDAGSTVQQVDYAKLRERLLADGQVLEWTATSAEKTATAPAPKLDGIVLDDAQAERKGEWTAGNIVESRRIGTGYIHDGNAQNGAATLSWTREIREAGEYEIVFHFPPNANRARGVPVTVSIGGKVTTVLVDERDKSGVKSLGKFQLPSGKGTRVGLTNKGTDGYVVADGLQLLKQ